jgi:hypothetical protein
MQEEETLFKILSFLIILPLSELHGGVCPKLYTTMRADMSPAVSAPLDIVTSWGRAFYPLGANSSQAIRRNSICTLLFL